MDTKYRDDRINNMLNLKEILQEELAENRQEISNIGYYKDFQFKGTSLGVNDVYIVKIKDDSVPEQDMKPREDDETYIYRIYDEDNNLIATVDEEGNVLFAPEYLENIDERYIETLDLEDAEFELPEELGKDDIVLNSEELEMEENKKRLDDVSKVIGSNNINSYSEMKTDQTPAFEKVTNKQELDPNTRVTQTETLADMIPEIKEKGIVKIGVVYSEHSKGQNGRFSFVGLDKDGQIHNIDSLENTQGTTTGQTVTSINSRDGSVVEEEQVAGLVRINGRNSLNGQEEMLSVKVGQYGILEVDYVRADLSEDKENRYLSAPIETRNIRPTTREVREFMDKSKNVDIEDELKRSEAELDRDGETKVYNMDDTASNDVLTADDVIVLEDGSKTTLRKEAAKAKVSVEDFVRRYNERTGKTPDEKINDIQAEYAEEYDLSKRSR